MRGVSGRAAWRIGLLALTLVLGAALYIAYWPEIAAWARDSQRDLQTALARAVRAVKGGDPMALGALLGACFLYGVVHAVGPGHGKLLISGAAAASRRAAWRMAAIGLAASLTQAATAILLAYGALGLAAASSRQFIQGTETVLAPLSFAAIGLIGLWIVARGVSSLRRSRRAAARNRAHAHGDADAHAHFHGHGRADGEHACCAHAPSPEAVERAEGWRDVLALIAAIGVRPCSGALIVLAIAWALGLYLAGALAAFAMAVGTGLVVGGVGLVAGLLRDAHGLRAGDGGSERLFGGVQIAVGLVVSVMSATFLSASWA